MAYNNALIRWHGSILAVQYACAGLKMPSNPDFSLPVPQAWRQMARRKLGNISKPLMVYRPPVLNNLFHCEPRLPDVESYAALYKSIQARYHTVSIANLGDYGEHIVGPEMDADTKFHAGQLAFEELAGLFAEAKLAFTCAGYAPVLAQAVGTPTVIVYGGHEGFRTTNSVGAHLAPTLAIEAINQCECHGGHYTHTRAGLVKPKRTHECPKEIDMPVALSRLEAFVATL
jgi:ADP-heptose:LPS heptosyltransferase